MIFKSIRSDDGTGALSYLIADEKTRRGILIDPNIEDLNVINQLLLNENIKLAYIIDTHTHADHITAAGELRNRHGAKVIMHSKTKEKWKVVDEGDKFGIGDILRANAKIDADIFAEDGNQIVLDEMIIKIIYTPGHTDNHIAILINDMLFTGDLLLIGQAGRSDLPGGNTEDQYDSLFNKIIPLPDNTKIYPGHDYEDNEFSYLKDEKRSNPFLATMSKEEYAGFVKDYFPPFAETSEEGKIILQCGTTRVSRSKEAFENIDPLALAKMIKNDEELFLLDVREEFELQFFGKIPGVINIPMGSLQKRINEIPQDKKVVAVCQSGNRSYEAAHFLSKKGYEKIYNLESGTAGWLYSREPEVKRLNSIGVSSE